VAFCYPFSKAIHKSRQLFLTYAKTKNLDFDLGEKIYAHFRELDIINININFTQPIYQTKQQKQLVYLTLSEAKSNYIANNLVTEEEIDQLNKEICEVIDDDSYLLSFPRTTQICGEKS